MLISTNLFVRIYPFSQNFSNLLIVDPRLAVFSYFGIYFKYLPQHTFITMYSTSSSYNLRYLAVYYLANTRINEATRRAMCRAHTSAKSKRMCSKMLHPENSVKIIWQFFAQSCWPPNKLTDAAENITSLAEVIDTEFFILLSQITNIFYIWLKDVFISKFNNSMISLNPWLPLWDERRTMLTC